MPLRRGADSVCIPLLSCGLFFLLRLFCLGFLVSPALIADRRIVNLLALSDAFDAAVIGNPAVSEE